MIYILGAGSMAREVLGIYKDLGLLEQVSGFIEENCEFKSKRIHDKEVRDSLIIDNLSLDSIFIGAMGSPKRKRWISEIENKKFQFDCLTHPSALKGVLVEIGDGSILCAGCILSCDIKTGKHTIINMGATINHDCVIGDFVTIGPGVNIAGNVRIKEGVWVGIGVKIINKVTIGKGSIIGAGAVVTKNIPENVLAFGVPAKPIREVKDSDWLNLT